MGRQGGIARFIGKCRQIVGYVDDGRPLWRKPSSLTKKKWYAMPTMEGQRVAARYFRAATAVAGRVWSGVPRELRKQSDGGAFNRLVGACRGLVEEDGRLWDLDSLAGMDLSLDSMGPLEVVGSVSGGGWRLRGVRELMDQLNEGVGELAGKRSRKYVVAQRFVDDGVTREEIAWEKMGEWRVKSEKVTVKSGKPLSGLERRRARARRSAAPHYGRAERRVRVWVYAAEVPDTFWDDHEGIFDISTPLNRSGGFVSDWLVVGAREKAAREYVLSGCDLQLPRQHPDASGIFVVFTGVEVAEKRGRHWVRLPWCSSMRVQEVVESANAFVVGGEDEGWSISLPGWGVEIGRMSLVAVPERRVEGMDRRAVPGDSVWREGSVYWDLVGRDGGVVLLEFKRPLQAVVDRFVEWGMVGCFMRAGP